MTSPRMLVLSGSVTPVAAILADGGSLLEAQMAAAQVDEVALVRYAGPAGHVVGPSEAPLDRVLRAVGGYALRDRFSRAPLGRLLNSLGPLDQGRVFWRAVRRDARAMELLRGADAVYAADLAAVKTGWIAVHRGWVSTADYDHGASAYVARLDAASTASAAREATAPSDTSD